MSERYNGLQNTAKTKSRYREKLRTVGLTIEDDPYIPENHKNYLTDNMSLWPKLWPKVEYGHIFAYFIECPSVYTQQQLLSWKQLESYNYFQNGYVGTISVWQFGQGDAKSCLWKAYANPSQKAPQNANQPWIICNPDEKVLTAHCTCMAG